MAERPRSGVPGTERASGGSYREMVGEVEKVLKERGIEVEGQGSLESAMGHDPQRAFKEGVLFLNSVLHTLKEDGYPEEVVTSKLKITLCFDGNNTQHVQILAQQRRRMFGKFMGIKEMGRSGYVPGSVEAEIRNTANNIRAMLLK